MKRVVKSICERVKRAVGQFAESVAGTPRRADGDGMVSYEVTMTRPLAEALADHYDDDPEVTSVTDALRQAARDVTGRAMAEGRVPMRMASDVTIDPETLTVTASRTIRPSGNSTVLTIPPGVLDAVGADAGDEVQLVAHMDTGVVEVSKVEDGGGGD